MYNQYLFLKNVILYSLLGYEKNIGVDIILMIIRFESMLIIENHYSFIKSEPLPTPLINKRCIARLEAT
jgi:hypothetical protein